MSESLSDIEQWARNKRGGPACFVCELPEDVKENLAIGWHKLGYRERQLVSYLSSRGQLGDGVTRHFIRRHFKEGHDHSE